MDGRTHRKGHVHTMFQPGNHKEDFFPRYVYMHILSTHLDTSLVQTEGMPEDPDALILVGIRVVMLDDTANGADGVPVQNQREGEPRQ